MTNEPPHFVRIDRRTSIKWMMTAAASVPLLQRRLWAKDAPAVHGYGTDPDVQKIHHPGDVWPLTLTEAQRRTAAALCDTIIPADTESPAASQVGVVDFLDEWVSAPYPPQQEDRKAILDGLAWIDAEARRRFAKNFASLEEADRQAICDDVCYLPKAKPEYRQAAEFFARYRDLTAGGFYTTAAGRSDLKYIGNIPLARFDGPPPEVLRKVGLL